ncbi:MAG: class I SAM-dependent methyltransferase [Deltaproteobacteria bacterium]|nr:class I SAM-dependent methyltransferase [Deltaproteobacteria bacterium]
MSGGDRDRWNAKYRASGHRRGTPAATLLELAERLPKAGRALDIAGGTGADAAWLAQRGLSVTLVDVSEVALGLAVESAARAGVDFAVVQADLTIDPLPPGPWDLVLCNHFVQRDLLPAVVQALAQDGLLLWVHPTVDNLARHPRPSRRFLLDTGEAVALVTQAGLEVVWHDEGWAGTEPTARHLARVLARRPTA